MNEALMKDENQSSPLPANLVRHKRKAGRITLPIYDERSGEYV